MPSPQGRWFLLTVPEADYRKPDQLHEQLTYIVGQLETAPTTGYRHWQICVQFKRKTTITGCRNLFGGRAHVELTRSSAAREYCRKEESRVDGTEFEFGRPATRRNNNEDWDAVWELAKKGDMEAISSNVRIQHYRTIRTIAADFAEPCSMERKIFVFCGRTGTGKSRRAWEEAGLGAYPKDPRSKFWDGYRNQSHVVIDEFRGGIDISHVLRWFDRYPVLVEIKGSATPLVATKIWVTSNIHPRYWFPMLDIETIDALLRRLEITVFE